MRENEPKSLALLRLTTTDGPIYFIVNSWASRDDFESDEEFQNNAAYFYEEHSCPTNFIRCQAIYTPDDDDPHGLFEHVRSVARPEGLSWDDEVLRALFPETREK